LNSRININFVNPAEKVHFRELSGKFTKVLSSSMKKDNQISLETINNCFKTLVKNDELVIENSAFGGVEYGLPERGDNFSGLKLKIPFPNKDGIIRKNDPDSIEVLTHEIDHVLRYKTQKGFLMTLITKKLPEKLDFLQDFFYEKFLHKNEVVSHYVYPEKMLNNKEARTKYVRKTIEKFLNKKSITPEQRVEILKVWQCGMYDELMAYKKSSHNYVKYKFPSDDLVKKLKNSEDLNLEESGAVYDSSKIEKLEEKLLALKEFIKQAEKNYTQKIIEKNYFFEGKIKVINEMLANETKKINIC